MDRRTFLRALALSPAIVLGARTLGVQPMLEGASYLSLHDRIEAAMRLYNADPPLLTERQVLEFLDIDDLP